MKYVALLLAFLWLSVAGCSAATTTVQVPVGSPASTSVSCSVTVTLTVPVPAGTTVCPIVVAPSAWVGTTTLSGTNASLFAVSGTNLVTASAITAPGTYSVTITTTP